MGDGSSLPALLKVCLLVVLAGSTAVPVIQDGPQVQSNSADDSILDQIAKVNQKYDKDLYEGDIVISQNESVKVDQGKTGDVDGKFEENRTRNAIRNREDIWKSKVIPYVIDSQLKSVTSVIQRSFNEFHRQTCVRFVPRTNQGRWIRFVKGYGCWSYVGKLSGKGAQKVSIGAGCQYLGIVIHELLHVLGFWHEQSRPDRNQYVEVLWENIQQGKENNFNKYSHGTIDTLKIPYDFKSVMHYGKYFFSKNGKPTIRAIINPRQTLGQRTGFTKFDVMEVNALYDRSGPSQGWSSWSDYGPCDINSCTKSRQRFCTHLDLSKCPGANSRGIENQDATCAAKECKVPVDGHWGRWSSWSQCSTTCGQGNHTRTRKCSNPPPQHGGKPCPGANIQAKGCKLRICGPGRSTTAKPTTSISATTKYPWTMTAATTRPPTTAKPTTSILVTTKYPWTTTAVTTRPPTTAKPTTSIPVTTKYPWTTTAATTRVPTTVKPTTSIPVTTKYPWTTTAVTTRVPTTAKPTTSIPATTKYPWTTTAATTRVPTTSRPGQGDDCDFDRDFCHWTNGPRTNWYPWTRRSSSTPSIGTGPSKDHTTGKGFYVYVETSLMSGANQTATLISKVFPPFCIRCMRFFYHMYGNAMGALNVYIRKIDIDKEYKIFSKTGNQGNQWHGAMVSFRSSYKYKIIFESVRGTSYTSDIALDDITFTDGPCPTPKPTTPAPTTTPRPTTTTPRPTTTLAPTTTTPTTTIIERCSFDQDFCSWTRGVGSNRYSWTRRSGSTPSLKTGPSRDHTTGSGYYVYVETSSPARPKQTATLVSRVFPPAPAGRCLTFYYYMYGATMGSLNVYVKRRNSNVKYRIFTKSGNQGNKWLGASVTLKTSYQYQVIFESVRGSSYTSDIAIDDVSFTSAPCATERCSFDQGFCSWTKGVGSNRYSWTRRSGSTPSYKTGPSRDHTTGSGYYVYVETSSPARPKQTATLVSRVFPPAPAGRCLTFYYHMYGATMGSLNVYVKWLNSNAKYKIFTKSGNQGNKWLSASVTLKTSYQYQIIFESVRGSSYTSDIAIDDVALVDGPCPRQVIERCSFERGFCSWTKGVGSNRYSWTRRSGSTPSYKTGPSRDHTTGSGYYVYVETSSPAQPKQTATLVSRVFPPAPAGRCLTFYYHMYGATMGSLNVFVKRLNNNAQYRFFTKSGNQGNKWHRTSITIRSYSKYKIIFQAVVGSSYQSDIALDDITITNGAC